MHLGLYKTQVVGYGVVMKRTDSEFEAFLWGISAGFLACIIVREIVDALW